ncbi:hypothetical protein NDA16_003446 [Ustilago loliicola]|nr:hypothetical protein NDA16_003446 [Ustilago loliicola]
MASTVGPEHDPNNSSSTPPEEHGSRASPVLPTTTKDERESASSSSLARTVSKDEPSLSSSAIRRNQFLALTKKNRIVLRSYWLVNLLRCLIIPIAYYVFLGEAKNFFNTTNDLGLGEPAPIRRFSDDLTKPIYWLDSSTSTTQSRFSSRQIMDVVLDGLQPSQRSLVRQVRDGQELGLACPQAFNGLSSCFGAVEFSDITEQGSVTYTLRLDPGLNRVRVSTNRGDAETRTLPLQFAIDAAILQLNGAPTESYSQPPLEQPYSIQTNAEQAESQRRGFLGGVDQLTVLAFFIGMLGVVWHLPSSVSEERGSGMTALLTTMGCGQLPRLLSWLCGPGAAYLPAWFVMGGSLSATLWTTSNKALCIFAHVLPGLAMASWSLFVATFFTRANVSSIITTAIAILFAIVALITKHIGEGGGIVIGFLFPSASFVYEFIAISAYEHEGLAADVTASHDGINRGPSILGQIIVQVIGIFLFPALTILLERKLFFAEPFFQWLFRRQPSSSSTSAQFIEKAASAATPALRINNLVKKYSKKESSLAVDGLDLEVPRGSITCLLGSNGSGKSITIGIVGGTIRKTSGEVYIDGFERGAAPPGLLGVCPQKDVLFNQLTCLQHVNLFRAIKHRRGTKDDPVDLLAQCELSHKLKSKPTQLSGGQKRRLQTAAALVGQSTFLMFDEATSGLDPLSRRAIWKILLNERGRRSILLTSHFLDEADLLGDHIVILAAPGKKLCEGTPIELKTRFGQGSTIQVSPPGCQVLPLLNEACPGTKQIPAIEPGQDSFLLPSTDQADIAKALEAIEEHKASLGVDGYDVAGPSLESVFLTLNSEHARANGKQEEVEEMEGNVGQPGTQVGRGGQSELSDGAVASVFALTLAQLSKRMVLYRRIYLPAIFAILVAVLGSIVPLAFFSNRDPSCTRGFRDREISETATFWNKASRTTELLYAAPEANAQVVFGNGFNLTSVEFDRVPLDQYNATIAQRWNADQRGVGGIALPGITSGANQFSYLADQGMVYPIAALNLVSNAGLASARGTNTGGAADSPTITSNYRPLSNLSLGNGLGDALKWAVVFGLVQAVWPAFAALYPSAERNNRVKAMALTNGMRAVPLWLGHLLAELPVILISTIPVAVVYAFASDQFAGEGVLWVVLFLHGVSSTLQSFVVSLFAPNQLAAFAIVAAWNVLAFLIFFATTMLTVTYYVGNGLAGALDAAYYVEAILAPSVSMTRAGFVSVNLFNLLCNGRGGYKSGGIAAVDLLGAPIIYTIVWTLVCFAILVAHDSGYPLLPSWLGFLRRKSRKHRGDADEEGKVQPVGQGVREEALRLDSDSCDDVLQAKHLDKSYGKLLAVDDVSLGVRREETVALLGINGGGKTTTHSLIRGELVPDSGSVTIAGIDVAQQRTLARSNIASVPQFDGLDPLLTVQEHLRTYARIKGVARNERKQNVEAVMHLTNLTQYAGRRAGALSGGNMRKLSLAIALLGNPAVLLLDELSSGVDSWTKRGLWQTLRRAGRGRATLLTSHSMEEAAALASRVAIQASRILAIDTITNLRRSHPAYELQLDIAEEHRGSHEAYERVESSEGRTTWPS